ncbi:MAG: fibronectin type III domain-containing protein [Flavobacteriales bacterium]|nr:fibronectin type III domain-containing protein [Flavobacteriales bacterium]
MRKVKANIKMLAGYVQAESGGDPVKIASAAFGTRKVPQPPGPMPAPPNLRLVITTLPGELKARWGGVKDKRLYVLEISDADVVPANWKPLAMTSRNFHLIMGLESHKPYSVRVLAVGSLGVGPWSDVATTKPL